MDEIPNESNEITKMTYTRDVFGHLLEDGNVPGVNFGLTHLQVVGVEPQVVGTVTPEILLVATQVQVPHTFFL